MPPCRPVTCHNLLCCGYEYYHDSVKWVLLEAGSIVAIIWSYDALASRHDCGIRPPRWSQFGRKDAIGWCTGTGMLFPVLPQDIATEIYSHTSVALGSPSGLPEILHTVFCYKDDRVSTSSLVIASSFWNYCSSVRCERHWLLVWSEVR
jgi:hypothetical protein